VKHKWLAVTLGLIAGSALLICLLIYLGARDQAVRSSATSLGNPSAAIPTPGINAALASPVPSVDARRHNAVTAIQSIYDAPITFYGVVRDHSGNPVPQAKVDYSIVDKFFGPGTKKTGVADDQGSFSLTGISGAALTVGVSKDGYAPIYQQSNGAFSYGMPFDVQRDRPAPTRGQPAIFILRKKTAAERLFVVDRDVLVPKTGSPVDISLKTGKPVSLGGGDLRIECWTSDDMKNSQGHYEWHARLSVPHGGLIARTDPEWQFEAPENGYQRSVEISMPQTSPRWERTYDGHYWLFLRDRTYARIRFRLNTAGNHFVSITCYLNPSGSRNLEYDEKRLVE
jgi:hypothetical protein